MSHNSVYYRVLDHGFVRLVSYTQPDMPGLKEVSGAYNPGWTGDLEVVRNARVSFGADWRTGEDEGKDEKLLRYMLRNHHTSPFEAMVFTFEVKAPIFIFRQWHRHRTWSYNEVSARYAELPEEFYVPKPEVIGVQSASNKQVRDIGEIQPWQDDAVGIILDHCQRAFDVYKTMLAMGVPRELARGVLPLNTYSRMFATVDLHNLMHFLTLRLHSHAQYEIREYAKALLNLVRPVCPITINEFEQGIGGIV
jgi:thymidylate synthase (FAD)